MTEKEAYQILSENCNIKVGDRVKVARKAETHQWGWGNSWVDSMNVYVGKEFIVTNKGRGGVCLKGVSYSFPFFVLEKIESKPIGDRKMSKILFDDGTEVEISKETEENLRKLRKLSIVTICDYNRKQDRIVVRLSEKVVRRVKNGKRVLLFNENGDIVNSYSEANAPLESFYKNPIHYGQLKETK